jgi:hypothetical protein
MGCQRLPASFECACLARLAEKPGEKRNNMEAVRIRVLAILLCGSAAAACGSNHHESPGAADGGGGEAGRSDDGGVDVEGAGLDASSIDSNDSDGGIDQGSAADAGIAINGLGLDAEPANYDGGKVDGSTSATIYTGDSSANCPMSFATDGQVTLTSVDGGMKGSYQLIIDNRTVTGDLDSHTCWSGEDTDPCADRWK